MAFVLMFYGSNGAVRHEEHATVAKAKAAAKYGIMQPGSGLYSASIWDSGYSGFRKIHGSVSRRGSGRMIWQESQL